MPVRIMMIFSHSKGKCSGHSSHRINKEKSNLENIGKIKYIHQKPLFFPKVKLKFFPSDLFPHHRSIVRFLDLHAF